MPRASCNALTGWGCLALLLLALPASGQTPAPVRLGGVLQLRETYEDDALTATVHRARLLVDGSLTAAFSFRFSADFRQGGNATTRAGVALVDAAAVWARGAWTVTAGQFKTPFTREYLMQVHTIESANRAAVSESLAPRRDIGVMVSYAGARATVRAGLFNGDGVNSVVNRDSAVLFVARATVDPAAPVDVGANVAVYGGDSTRYGVDALWERGRLTARVELIGQHHAGGTADDYGWYGFAMVRVSRVAYLLVRQEDLLRRAATPSRELGTTVGGLFDFADQRVRLFVNYLSKSFDGTRRGTFITQLQLRF